MEPSPAQRAVAGRQVGEALVFFGRLAVLLGVVGGGGCDGGGDAKRPGDRSDTNTATADDTGTGTDTSPPEDADGDGYLEGEDCADWSAEMYPGAPDDCDGLDDDCDGIVDNAVPGEATECIDSVKEWFIQELDGYHADGSAIAASGDIDRDGLPDLLLGGGAYGYGVLHVFLNAELWAGDVPTSAARWTLWGDAGDSLATSALISGRAVDFYPDMDGDGSDEILVGATGGWGGEPGRVYLVTAAALEYEYGELEISAVSDLVLEDGSGITEGNGLGVVTLGDIDGDELAEVYVQAHHDGWVVPGAVIHGATPSLEQGVRVSAPTGYGEDYLFGRSVAPAGDLDGDGLADLLVPCLECEGNGAVYLFTSASVTGAESLEMDAADLLVTGEAGQNLPMDLAAGADADGDGLADWAICSYMLGEAGGVSLFLGTPDLLTAGAIRANDATIHIFAFDGTPGGFTLALADFTGDALGDVLLEGSGSDDSYYLFTAASLPEAGTVDLAAWSRRIAPLREGYSAGQLRAADWDADSVSDLLVGQPGWSEDGDFNSAGGALLMTGFP